MTERDDIGNRGEALLKAQFTDFCGRAKPLFRSYFLGEKTEHVDFLVELVESAVAKAFFFVQIRSTALGFTRKAPRRLKVGIAGDILATLALIPAPVYVVGMDIVGRTGFLLAVLEGMSDPLPSFPTDFPLDCANMVRLYQEVEAYWSSRDMCRRDSFFRMAR